MAQILCSTGALLGRPNGRDYKLLKEILPQLHFDGIEFMIYSSWYNEIDELISFLLSLNQNIPVVHCEKAIGKSITLGGDENINDALYRFKLNCSIAQRLGAEKAVLHLWDGVPSDSHFENNINTYPKLAEIANNYGLKLLIENVVCNHLDPMTHWLELVKLYPDIGFIFDTKMAAFHNQLDLIYQPEYAFLHKNNHIQHYHINDYAGGYMDWENLKTLCIGKGNIDFNRFFGYIKDIGYNGTFTVESTAFDSNGVINTEMLNNEYKTIKALL